MESPFTSSQMNYMKTESIEDPKNKSLKRKRPSTPLSHQEIEILKAPRIKYVKSNHVDQLKYLIHFLLYLNFRP